MPKRCWPLLLLALALGGCGSASSSADEPGGGPPRGIGMSAPIDEFKVARRQGAGRVVEPGRHSMAAAPCTGTGQHGIALVDLFPEISTPRCLMVTPDERILVINRTGAFERQSAVPITVHLGAYSAKLAPQQAA